jgi:hypothetical protein
LSGVGCFLSRKIECETHELFIADRSIRLNAMLLFEWMDRLIVEERAHRPIGEMALRNHFARKTLNVSVARIRLNFRIEHIDALFRPFEDLMEARAVKHQKAADIGLAIVTSRGCDDIMEMNKQPRTRHIHGVFAAVHQSDDRHSSAFLRPPTFCFPCDLA